MDVILMFPSMGHNNKVANVFFVVSPGDGLASGGSSGRRCKGMNE